MSGPLPPGEGLRKGVHATMGLFALALPFLTWWQAALCALAAFLFNWQVLPRSLGHRFATGRPDSSDRGVLLYPLVVLGLIATFRYRLEWAACGWGVLALGDALAGVVGQKWGEKPLPWNSRKTWEGFLAFWLGSVVGGAALAVFYLAVRDEGLRGGELFLSLGHWVLLLAAPAVFGAVLESLPHGLDDNVLPALAVPTLALLGSDGVESAAWGDWLWALGVNLLCAGVALMTQVLRPAGVASAMGLGLVTWLGMGRGAFFLLLAFLLLGLWATFLGYGRKKARGLAEGHGGRRGWAEVMGKGGVVLALGAQGMISASWGGGLAFWAPAAALAGALADTWGTELGGLLGRRAWALPQLRLVPPGTPGAVSCPGLLAAGMGSFLLSCLGWYVGLLPSFNWVWAVAGAGWLAAVLESSLGQEVATHGGKNLAVTVLPLVVLLAFLGGWP